MSGARAKVRGQAPAAAAAAIVHALADVLRRRLDARSRRALSWFAASSGRLAVAVDTAAVAAFVRTRWDAMLRLLRRRDDLVRHAAVWSLSTTGDPRLVPALVDLLQRQRGCFDHDYVFAAVSCLGTRAIAPLARIALRHRGRVRTAAIECLGHTRGGVRAVRALASIVRRFGCVDGVSVALSNLNEGAGLELATRGLASDDPAARADAMEAVLDCLEASLRTGQVRARTTVVRRVARALADERVWAKAGDPWISLCCFGLDALALLQAPCFPQAAQRALRSGCEERREAAVQARRRFRRRIRTRR